MERAAYLALVRDYPMLRPALQLALDELWSDARGTIDPPPPDFGGSLGLGRAWRCKASPCIRTAGST